MKPIDIYKQGLKDGIEFCVKCIRDMPLSDDYVRDAFNVAANYFNEVLREYDLDHSAEYLEKIGERNENIS